MPKLAALVILAVLASSCRSEKPATPPPPQGSATAQPKAKAKAIAFIEDDYPRALALAREKGLPIFVDSWAPWCHTCRAMNANVFPDPALAVHAERFVWLSIDTEKEENAAFLSRFPQQVWPTLLVVDPTEEKAVLRWQGSATVSQLEELLVDAERAARQVDPGEGKALELRLAAADRLYGEGKIDEAIVAFEALLEEAEEGWARRARAVESLLAAKAIGRRDSKGCAELALRELQALPRSSSWANIASLGLFCSLRLDQPPASWLEEAVSPLEARAREALGEPAIEIAADDRSGLYDSLVAARELAGDEAGKKKVAAEWLAFLEGAAAKEADPDARSVYDSHRIGAAMLIGEPERVVGALRESEEALPNDYNPPARLAVVYHRMDRLDDAIAASDRALKLVYGPRKVRVLNERGAILVAKGDRDGGRRAYEEARSLALSLSASQRPRRELERAEARLEALASEAGP